jgi:hypothetical protein
MQFSSLSGGAASGGQDGRDVRKLSEMFTACNIIFFYCTVDLDSRKPVTL